MKIIFLKDGKYRDARFVITVSEKDVESKKVFEVDSDKADYYIKADCAKMATATKKAKEPNSKDFDPKEKAEKK